MTDAFETGIEVRAAEQAVDFFSPSRRWARVVDLCHPGQKPSRREKDRFVLYGCRYLRRWMAAEDPTATAVVAADFADIHWAFMSFSGKHGSRWIIEAGVLAGADAKTIAEYLDASKKSVEMFERFFYNVRGKIDSRGFILSLALTPKLLKDGFDPADPDFTYKVIAYGLGWEALKQYADTKNLSDEGWRELYDALKSRLLRNAWAASYRVTINNFNAMEVIGKLFEALAHEHNVGGASSGDSTQQFLEEAFRGISLKTIPMTAQIPADEPRFQMDVASFGSKTGAADGKAQ